MIRFAIDLGQSSLKMKSDKGEYSFPSAYLPADNILSIGNKLLSDTNDNQIYQISSETTSFIWGDNLEKYHLPEKIISGYVRSHRFNQKKVQRLLKFALARLAKDYVTESTRSFVIYLQIGVTASEFLDYDTVESLKELLIGKHDVKVDGEEFTINIPDDTHILIMPEYTGTVMNRYLDEVENNGDDYIQENIGIVDIGGGTILAGRSNSQIISPVFSERFEGIQTLIKAIALEAGITKEFLIEKLLKDGHEVGKYEYKINQNKSYDISDIVSQQIDKYTRFTIAPFITENFPDLDSIDGILITGGGANLISRESLFDEVGGEYFQLLNFVKNPEMANIRGFFKSGLLISEGLSNNQDSEQELFEVDTTLDNIKTELQELLTKSENSSLLD